MRKKHDILRLIVAFLTAATVVHCVWALIICINDNLPHSKYVEIEVKDKNTENGGSELWVAQEFDNFDLERAPMNSGYNGALEYRLAAEYGYMYNFLVSYGDNIGSRIRIDLKGKSAEGLLLYNHQFSGVVDISYSGVTKSFNLYSNEPFVMSVELRHEIIPKWLTYVLQVLLILALTKLFYWAIQKMWENNPKKSNKDITGTKEYAIAERESGVDVARTVAAFLVTLVHSYFAAYDFYFPTANEANMSGSFIMLFIHWVSFECVPLFMIITGYLCIKKRNIKEAYSGLKQYLLVFLFVTVIRVVFIEWLYWKAPITFSGIIHELLGMDLAWYLEMYVGLVLLMPFINKMWEHIGETGKKVLLAVLLFLTSARYVFGDYVPDYWLGLMPFTYYFIGAYIRENPINGRGEESLLTCNYCGVDSDNTKYDWKNKYWNIPSICKNVWLFSGNNWSNDAVCRDAVHSY